MRYRLTIEYIRESFEKAKYILLSEIYEKGVKLEYICPNGHRHSTLWGNWQQGYRCPYCAGQNKPDITSIKSEFEQEEFVLLTEVYVNNRTKLEYICPNGHRHSISYGAWQQGQRCPYCQRNAKLNLEYIKFAFEKEGWVCTSEEYINSHSKLDYICPNGHIGTIQWGNWQQGKRCPQCSGNVKKTIEFIGDVVSNDGYSMLSTEYVNAHSKLYVECPKGHRYYVTWNNWRNGRRCPSCTSAVSKWESEVKGYVESLNISFLSNNQSILINDFTGKNLELDLWFPQLNKAIECNGLYWHSVEKVVKRDKIKLELCKEKSIDLLILNDEEWENNKPSCKNKIDNFIVVKEVI
ncbi:hypothetical protein KAW18_16865 [candidate division WOR-3 bacterium]|nr:hypothetical protein [candidate division WOR-3 bacterium]